MSSTIILPAIRSHVGDWTFYTTTLSFREVKQLISHQNEIHERKKLADWIQRELIDSHADEISDYINSNTQRFLGALIVGVYDGNPCWGPLDINFSRNLLDISEIQQEQVSGKLGLLKFSGDEKLFAIDGQHRVAGIKKALEDPIKRSGYEDDDISVLFVTHDISEEGKKRTRRLFTTVNKKAKRISKAAQIALDEDNGFAIVTRLLIDQYFLFEDDRHHISYTSSGSIPASDKFLITSVVGLYEIVRDLHSPTGRSNYEKNRPSEEQVTSHLNFCTQYFNELMIQVDSYKDVFVDNDNYADYYRVAGSNNLTLFRPVGQRMFARCTQLLISRGKTLKQTISILLNASQNIEDTIWKHILWNPVDETMIHSKLVIAESQLLNKTEQAPRTEKNGRSLQEYLDGRDN